MSVPNTSNDINFGRNSRRGVITVMYWSRNRLDLPRKTIRRRNQRIKNARLVVGVAGTLDQMEVRLRPGLVQLIRIARRAGHIVTAMHNRAFDPMKPKGIAQELTVFKPAVMREVVVFQAREGEGEVILGVLARQLGVRKKRDRFAFP